MAQNLPEYGKKLSLCKTLKSHSQHLVSGKLKNTIYIICMLFFKYWHRMDLNIMASVNKLVLVPKKIVRD